MKTSAPRSASTRLPVRPPSLVAAASWRLTVGEVLAAAVQHALAVGDRDVADAGLAQDRRHRDPRCAGARHDGAQVAQDAAGEQGSVAQRGEHDDGRAVLVVVEDRDVEPFLERPLDLEAPRRADVLEVDAAERRRDAHDGLDDVVDVVRVQADRHRVDAAELLEQHRLALHHRQRRGRADVTETEHGGAVGDDGDDVRLPGQVVHQRPGARRSRSRPGRRRACRRATGRRGCAAGRSRRSPACRPRCSAKAGSLSSYGVVGASSIVGHVVSCSAIVCSLPHRRRADGRSAGDAVRRALAMRGLPEGASLAHRRPAQPRVRPSPAASPADALRGTAGSRAGVERRCPAAASCSGSSRRPCAAR